jgi:hypothetical protein
MFQPVIQKFKDAFFGGEEADQACAEKSTPKKYKAQNPRKRPQ